MTMHGRDFDQRPFPRPPALDEHLARIHSSLHPVRLGEDRDPLPAIEVRPAASNRDLRLNTTMAPTTATTTTTPNPAQDQEQQTEQSPKVDSRALKISNTAHARREAGKAVGIAHPPGRSPVAFPGQQAGEVNDDTRASAADAKVDVNVIVNRRQDASSPRQPRSQRTTEQMVTNWFIFGCMA